MLRDSLKVQTMSGDVEKGKWDYVWQKAEDQLAEKPEGRKNTEQTAVRLAPGTIYFVYSSVECAVSICCLPDGERADLAAVGRAKQGLYPGSGIGDTGDPDLE